MAISLYYLHEHNDDSENEPKKSFFSPGGLWLIKFLVILSAAVISYLVLFSKIVQLTEEEYIYQKVYYAVKDFNSRAASTSPELKFTGKEKALVTDPDPVLAERLSGYFLLQVESGGEAWYVNPEDNKKYYLGETGEDVRTMRRLTHFAVDTAISASALFPKEEAGSIVVSEKEPAKIYYISPKDRRAYAIEEPKALLAAIRKFGIGISNADIRKIEVGEITEPKTPLPVHSMNPPRN